MTVVTIFSVVIIRSMIVVHVRLPSGVCCLLINIVTVTIVVTVVIGTAVTIIVVNI